MHTHTHAHTHTYHIYKHWSRFGKERIRLVSYTHTYIYIHTHIHTIRKNRSSRFGKERIWFVSLVHIHIYTHTYRTHKPQFTLWKGENMVRQFGTYTYTHTHIPYAQTAVHALERREYGSSVQLYVALWLLRAALEQHSEETKVCMQTK